MLEPIDPDEGKGTEIAALCGLAFAPNSYPRACRW